MLWKFSEVASPSRRLSRACPEWSRRGVLVRRTAGVKVAIPITTLSQGIKRERASDNRCRLGTKDRVAKRSRRPPRLTKPCQLVVGPPTLRTDGKNNFSLMRLQNVAQVGVV